jgi:hypothetical protein
MKMSADNSAKPEFAAKTGKPSGFCHRNTTGGALKPARKKSRQMVSTRGSNRQAL